VAKRIVVSNEMLTAIFWRKMRTYPGCAQGVPIAIVPDRRFGWKALTAPYIVRRYPLLAKRVGQAQNELRKMYALAKE
jgi:hypothetical protein